MSDNPLITLDDWDKWQAGMRRWNDFSRAKHNAYLEYSRAWKEADRELQAAKRDGSVARQDAALEKMQQLMDEHDAAWGRKAFDWDRMVVVEKEAEVEGEE